MAPPEACSNVLVEKNLTQFGSNRSARLYMMSLMSRSTFNQTKIDIAANGSGSYGPYGASFAGSYDEFQQRAASEQASSQQNFSSDEAISSLTLVGLPGAVDAWRDCMTLNKAGLFCWLEGHGSETVFTLHVRWAPPTGLGGVSLSNAVFGISADVGTAKYENPNPASLHEGDYSVTIRRASKNTAVRGFVNGDAGVGGFTTSYYIPSQPLGLSPNPFYLSEQRQALLSTDNVYGQLQFDRVYWRDDVWINGIQYFHAIGMHAPLHTGSATFSIPPGAQHFRSIFGLARADSDTDILGHGIGRVYIDKHPGVVWTGRVDNAHKALQVAFDIPSDAQWIRFEVDGEGDNWSSHTTWGDPEFTATPTASPV